MKEENELWSSESSDTKLDWLGTLLVSAGMAVVIAGIVVAKAVWSVRAGLSRIWQKSPN
jgi:hypothetical protein